MLSRLTERRHVDAFALLTDELLDGAPQAGAEHHESAHEHAARAPERRVPAQRADSESPPHDADAGPEHDGARANRAAPHLAPLGRAAAQLVAAARTNPPRLADTRRVAMRAALVAAAENLSPARTARLDVVGDDAAQSDADSDDPAPRHTNPAAGRHAGAPRRPWAKRRLVIAGSSVGVLLVGAGGIAIASTNAMPGDPLYGIKRTVEQVQLDLSTSPTDRGVRYLDQARTRLGEIDWLLNQPDAGTPGSVTQQRLASTLHDLSNDVTNGCDTLLDRVTAHDDQRAARDLAAFLNAEQQPITALEQRLAPPLRALPAPILAAMRRAATQLATLLPSVLKRPGNGGSTPGAGTQPPAGTSGVTGSPSPGNTTGREPAGPVPTSTSTSGGDSVGVSVPLPLPSSGLTVPPLLPGLPTIGIGVGTPGASATPSTPQNTDTPTPGDPNPND
jgi:hypothetical protein